MVSPYWAHRPVMRSWSRSSVDPSRSSSSSVRSPRSTRCRALPLHEAGARSTRVRTSFIRSRSTVSGSVRILRAGADGLPSVAGTSCGAGKQPEARGGGVRDLVEPLPGGRGRGGLVVGGVGPVGLVGPRRSGQGGHRTSGRPPSGTGPDHSGRVSASTETISARSETRTRSMSAMESSTSPVITTPPLEQPVQEIDQGDLPLRERFAGAGATGPVTTSSSAPGAPDVRSAGQVVRRCGEGIGHPGAGFDPVLRGRSCPRPRATSSRNACERSSRSR